MDTAPKILQRNNLSDQLKDKISLRLGFYISEVDMFYKKIKELIQHATFDNAPIPIYDQVIPALEDLNKDIDDMEIILRLEEASSPKFGAPNLQRMDTREENDQFEMRLSSRRRTSEDLGEEEKKEI